MLSALNFKRAAAQARTWPRFNEFKFAVLGTAGMCFSNRPDNFIPGSLLAPIKGEFESLHARLTESAGKSHDDKVRRFFANQSTPSAGNAGYLHGFDQDYPQQIANLQVLAQAAGASIANWSIVMRPGTMEFANGQYGFSNFGESFLEEARKDPELKKFLDNGGTGSQFPSYPLVNCANLAPLSVNAIQSSAPLTSEKFLDSQSPILKCMSCHTVPFQNGSVTIETAGAAFYPFDEPMKLRPLLQANGGALADSMKFRVKKQSDDPEYMPRRPTKALSEEEKTAFVNFIDRLTN
jgi:hypothetical protein